MAKRVFRFPICSMLLALLCVSIPALADNVDLASAQPVLGGAANLISGLQVNAENTEVSIQQSLVELPWGLCVFQCALEGSTFSALVSGADELSPGVEEDDSSSSTGFARFGVASTASTDNIDLGSPRLYAGLGVEASVLPLNGDFRPDHFTYPTYINFPAPSFYVELPWAWELCGRNCASQSQSGIYALPIAFSPVHNFRGWDRRLPEWRNDKKDLHKKKLTVPEPSSLLLLGTGFLRVALGLKRRLPR